MTADLKSVAFAYQADEQPKAFRLAQRLLDEPEAEHEPVVQYAGPWAGKCVCGNDHN